MTTSEVDTSTVINPADVLREAARILERDGWCRGVTQDITGRYCTTGALGKAALVLSSDDRVFPSTYLAPCLSLARFLGVDTIVDWNDRPERTAEEVIRSLRACADHLENPPPQ